MNTLTLYLRWIILASTAYPSGFGYSIYSIWRGSPQVVSTGLLGALTLPFVFVVPAVWALGPAAIVLRGTSIRLLALAALLAPVALVMEYCIQGLAAYRLTGAFPRRLAVANFWNVNLSPAGHVLVVLIAAGEEVFFRLIWIEILLSFSVPAPLALAISSVAYALNHLYSGAAAVFSKFASGLMYGALYLFGGQSIWLPIVTHVLQNLVLFKVTRGNRG
jgi:membrane protease YdiL (CAAX protease family)